MHELPHHYQVSASAESDSPVTVQSEGKPSLVTAPPVQFGGDGKEWSPEDLLVASVADCYLFSFKAIASAMRFDWLSMHCDVVGTLDKVERAMQFTKLEISVRLTISADTDPVKAERLLQKAENLCLITNSLKSEVTLKTEILT